MLLLLAARPLQARVVVVFMPAMDKVFILLFVAQVRGFVDEHRGINYHISIVGI